MTANTMGDSAQDATPNSGSAGGLPGVGLPWKKVQLSPPDPQWPRLFSIERDRLEQALGDRLLSLEHVGSTAIPGMFAKPIVDIAAEIPDLELFSSLRPILERLGYEYHPEIVIPGEIFLRDVAGIYHLHLLPPNSPYREDYLFFRDYLKTHPPTARKYTALKRSLAARFPDDRPSYTRGKVAFIQKVLSLRKRTSNLVPGQH